jgi:hypothetical protein
LSVNAKFNSFSVDTSLLSNVWENPSVVNSISIVDKVANVMVVKGVIVPKIIGANVYVYAMVLNKNKKCPPCQHHGLHICVLPSMGGIERYRNIREIESLTGELVKPVSKSQAGLG